MNQEQQIIKFLKNSYPRDTRKQVVKSILFEESQNNTLKDKYNIINQIFSYVLQELSWNMSKNSHEWDVKPLNIMKSVFPNIETTKWYKEQIIVTNSYVELVQGN